MVTLKSITIHKKSPEVKNYICAYRDGVIQVRTLFLCDDEEDETLNTIYRKFGKFLRERLIHAISRETLEILYDVSNQEVEEGKIIQQKVITKK